MIHKLYQKQVEAWKERFGGEGVIAKTDENMILMGFTKAEVLSSRHKDTIELIEAMIERKRGLRKEKPKGKCMNLENHLHGSCFECKKIDGFNEAIDEDITYLEEQLKLIKKEL